MKIVIAGGTGNLGKNLIGVLSKSHDIIVLTRKKTETLSKKVKLVNYSQDIKNWCNYLKDSDVIINLVGESIANKRWTKKQKQIILNSRLNAIQKISDSLKFIKHNPKIIMNASAVGYYKSSSTKVDESDGPGDDFLSNVCVKWEEKANEKFSSQTSQLILLRIGIVLDSNSGMLSKLILPFKLFLGAIIGNGKQFIPWIHINDVSKIICYLMKNKIQGPVNLVSPKIDDNENFSRKLAKALNVFVFLKVPSFVIKLLLGQMSTMLLKNSNINPKTLLDSGYKFEFENLDDALNDLLS